MKKAVLLILAVLMIGSAHALMELDGIKGYVNNEREGNIDKDGGTFEVYPDDIIDLVVTLRNEMNTTTQGRLYSTLQNIDDGDDIVKEQNWYNVGAYDDRSKTLSYSIPTDANRDTYDLDLEIRYKYDNGTEGQWDVSFEVDVNRDSSTEEVTDLHVMSWAITNLTERCVDIADVADSCFGYAGRYDNCSSELSTVKEERGTYKTKSDDCVATLENRDTTITELNADKADLNRQIIQLQNEKANMITEHVCNNRTASAVINANNTSNSKHNQTLMIIAGIGLAAFLWYNKNKNKKSVPDSYINDFNKI